MKVYIVYTYDVDGSVWGAYSSIEKVKARFSTCDKWREDSEHNYIGYSDTQACFFVLVLTIDDNA